ncbi:hypothetical protein OGAPHI_006731 [Ogataea philodendri]|uniref:Uncharacterized protein n=1 Tax=Ogataea philodendri TaxID=1378263 RepID=A0A9P8T0M1_9ASCO|nr:uncharacterized protein OGAPHI_006731 [Ogataea philodendri]KAH3661324.1 hypothetical protein OGAPHI_006731 [Ogataea philodendri]
MAQPEDRELSDGFEGAGEICCKLSPLLLLLLLLSCSRLPEEAEDMLLCRELFLKLIIIEAAFVRSASEIDAIFRRDGRLDCDCGVAGLSLLGEIPGEAAELAELVDAPFTCR